MIHLSWFQFIKIHLECKIKPTIVVAADVIVEIEVSTLKLRLGIPIDEALVQQLALFIVLTLTHSTEAINNDTRNDRN